jgi:hypothetical protein
MRMTDSPNIGQGCLRGIAAAALLWALIGLVASCTRHAINHRDNQASGPIPGKETRE